MFDITPKTVIRETTFGNEAVDMGIPFERTTKGVELINLKAMEVELPDSI